MKKLRVIFAVILVVFILSFLGLYIFLNTPLVSRRVIPQVLQKNFKDYRLKSFSLGSQQFLFPNIFVFRQVKLALVPVKQPDSKPYELQFDRMTIVVESATHLRGFVSNIALNAYDGELKGDVSFESVAPDIRVKMDLEGTNFVYNEKYKIDRPYLKADIVLTKNRIKDLYGFFKISAVEVSSAKVSNIVSDIKGDQKQIVLTNFTADAYDGKLSGEISVEHQSPFAYSVDLDIHKMNFRALAETSAALFSQFEGALDGAILVEGDRNKIRTIESDFSVPGGGKARAALVAYLLQYIPQGTKQREVIDFLLSTDGKIAAETITLKLKNIQPDQITGVYRIYSKELNVDINQSFDLKLDGEIVSLFEMGNRIMDGLMAVVSPSHAKKEGS